MMKLPNLYELKNYKFLILIPTAMILISLYFILVVKIPTGVDLRGGTLLTITTNSSFDQNALQNALRTQLGVRDVSVNTVQNPSGTNVQIEIEQNPSIASGENDMLNFYTQEDTVNTLQYDISRYTSDLQGGNLTGSQKADEQSSLAAAQAQLPQATQNMHSAADSVIADY